MTTLAILIWPMLALILFAWMPILLALIWATLLPYLFLPEAFEINLPGLPDLNKSTVISFGLFIGLCIHWKKLTNLKEKRTSFVTGSPLMLNLIWACVIIIALGNLLTVLTNSDGLVYGQTFVAPTRLWDAFTQTILLALTLLPFWIGLRFVATQQMHSNLLVALALASLVYTLLMLVEIRLSPQLHFWVYGYYQHEFVQHIRDGFRPMVFLQHGLWVGFFTFTGLIATLGLWKSTKNVKWSLAALWLFGVLLISKNVGAVIIGAALGTMYITFGKRLQMFLILTLAVTFLAFPILRHSNVLNTNMLSNAAHLISPERAGSLNVRLENEDLMLAKAAQKPFFGWGGWGRARVYDAEGRDVSTTDGLWIIQLGEKGLVGYFAFFGLLAFPLISLHRVNKRKDVPVETLALAMIGTGNLIYMIPNATLTPVSWLIFGAIAGFVVYDHKPSTAPTAINIQEHKKLRYTRFAAPYKMSVPTSRADRNHRRFTRSTIQSNR